MIVGPLDVPLRFQLLVMLLLAIELLLACHQPSGLRFDIHVPALRPRAKFGPLRFDCFHLLRDVLARPGYAGIMAFTLAEAVWLADTGTAGDILVAYPSADRAALAVLCGTEARAAAISIMVDDPAQLDLVDDVVPPDKRPTVRVCLELDASWRPAGRARACPGTPPTARRLRPGPTAPAPASAPASPASAAPPGACSRWPAPGR